MGMVIVLFRNTLCGNVPVVAWRGIGSKPACTL
jgi:hypothetical protein